MAEKEIKKTDISQSLKELAEIVDWFEQQEDIDVEKGLEKVKKAATLIKNSKGRLAEIENEFEEIKKEIGVEKGNDEDEAYTYPE
jgi:exonuclease VII small subunit